MKHLLFEVFITEFNFDIVFDDMGENSVPINTVPFAPQKTGEYIL